MTQPKKRPNWTDRAPANWGEHEAYRVAREIERLRAGRSTQWLADRTKELGCEVSRSVITDLENGRRRYVTTAELLVLAAALNVPPVVLVYPGPRYEEYIEVLPGVQSTEIDAVQWFSGIRDHGYTDSASRPAESARLRGEYEKNIGRLQAWRRLLEVEHELAKPIPANPSEEARKLIEERLVRLRDERLERRFLLGLEPDA
ncbi:helix-turn-helix domain-containing protein [Mycobacterium canetti]|uniref:HTH cro/C1-type domain-containing protein n=1 Tax=Mycobacterium canettii (strain CIPT 140010059) TaxID=1048245 RepID=A0AB72XR42_MYCCP|nr:helix-turn-helix domain-containing protein [Mycobacterium canetti]MBA2788288.1 helix-turn-helix domain-containing protein [Mycobacterium canetti]CCC45993.1 putative uncharacterised protein [Mycobacterium canettii CIPT 140010059]